jgi:hypothetical protein
MAAHLDKTHLNPANRHGLELRSLLLGAQLDVEVPVPTELAAAATALAIGAKRKALIPLASAPIEYALVRRGHAVLVSCYGTASAPTVYQLDREVPLRRLLECCAQSILDAARLELDPTARQIAVRVAERALSTNVCADPEGMSAAINQRGGHLEPPDEGTPLAFGFEAAIYPSSEQSRSARADVHGLLFEGKLWAFVRGRKLSLSRGPIMLAVHRMLVAVRTLVDAWDSGHPTNVRLRSGGFQIGMRLGSSQTVSVALISDAQGELGANSLTVEQAALPILKLTNDLLRCLVAADRGQSRNLRVRALRQEVRQLRREIRTRRGPDSFVNVDPDRLRVSNPAEPARSEPHSPKLSSLHFDEKWRVSLDGLDANSVFMCGDRLVVATPGHLLAIGRDDGEVIWARPGQAAATLMARSVLIRVSNDGEVELCSVEDGEPFSVAHIAPRIGGPASGLMAGGGTVPPIAILTEGSHRLVAIDARTGEPRWRFASRTGGDFRMTKFGRVLLVTSGEEAIHALDIATGEDVWRFAERGNFGFRPVVQGETVVTAATRNRERGVLFGIDLYSGELRWKQELNGVPSSDPCAAGAAVLLSTAGAEPLLSAYHLESGRSLWESRDPGLGIGGAGLAIDDTWVLNAPFGQLTGLDVRTGQERWSTNLADALADEIPRRLEPVLRGGALFVPASAVHVVRPADGKRLSANLPCELVPDLMRVDERGWVYIAEESGYLAAYAPKPVLTLLRGGRG